MPLLLRPATEADVSRLPDIQFASFGEDPFMAIMFPQTPSAESKQKAVERTYDDFKNPYITLMKVIDTDLDNEIVAFARWHIYRLERPESEWNTEIKREWGEGVNVEVADAFFTAIQQKRKCIMAGKPHCLLGILVTHPKHQRRGAGAMLVQWGTNLADEAGLPCYLEASSQGYRLYEKKGFEDVEFLDMDLTKWGYEGVDRHVCMIRPAKDK